MNIWFIKRNLKWLDKVTNAFTKEKWISKCNRVVVSGELCLIIKNDYSTIKPMIMKKIVFLLVLFPAIFCNGCKKEDLTDTIDITQFSWKIESITVDGDKTKTPNIDYHGNSISNDNSYKLIFQNDSEFNLDLGINYGGGTFKIPYMGMITFESFGTTEICCDSDFDEDVAKTIVLITSYQVLNDILKLKGSNCEIELKKE